MAGRSSGGGLHGYDRIISPENLLIAWQEFIVGKREKKDVQEFALDLMDNIFELHADLATQIYHHGLYQNFRINDPKPRNISKAPVRDRLLHHAIHRILYPFFDKKFIADSYSCRIGRGTHKALNRFRQFAYRVSHNHTRTCWVLKCDIKKFFASIDHDILIDILKKQIADEKILDLLNRIIQSFSPGLPLGNLTSQLLVNIYMNEFDQLVKHRLKAKYYIRYADDFVFLHHEKSWLEEFLPRVGDFLQERLHLALHPNKVSIHTLASGIDFLGWVHFPDHRVLRTTTKSRMMRRLQNHTTNETMQSYRGLLSHGNTSKISDTIFGLAGGFLEKRGENS